MNTIESKLFHWQDWDAVEAFSAYFMDCTLKVPIGNHKAGEEFATIYIDGENSTITLENINGDQETYELSYSVGNKTENRQEEK